MSITKNRQTPEVLRSLCAAAFPDRSVSAVTELTEGLFNAAYRIEFTDGDAAVLKIAAADSSGLLSNEINMMQAEITAMQLAQQYGLPYVPRVRYTDFSRTRCSGSFFFMDCLPGRSLNSCRNELSAQVQAHVQHQVGALQRRLTSIHSDHFGLLGDAHGFGSQYELVRYLFSNVLRDARARQVDLPFSDAELFSRLEGDRTIFDDVALPSLVHWDMWEGNLLVENGELSGVIDWERAMWADPLMDDRFRRHNRNAAFLEGFGQTAFSPAEQGRIVWYDLFLYTTMVTECFYRLYENKEGMLSWLRLLLNASWADVIRA
ncbi:MAG: phosphotransferase family protein [Aristaeellaceae bacterium]